MSPAARATIIVVAIASVLSGCGPLDKSHWAKGHVSGNKTFALDLVYGGNSTGLATATYADVPAGTVGTVELTGTQHWRCQGQFRNHQAETGIFPWDMENLPGLTPPGASDPVVDFFPPPGSYTITVGIPSLGAELKQSATLDPGNGPDAATGLYQHAPGCVLIAQAEQQFATANQATEPAMVQSGYSEVARTLGKFKDAVSADFPDLPPMHVIWATDDAIALLSQSGLS